MAWNPLAAHTFVTGDALTAANAKAWISDPITNLNTAIGSWTAWSPVLTASTTNPTNYTSVGEYIQIGDLVTARFVFNSSASWTQGSGNYFVSLPVTAVSPSSGFVEGFGIVRPAAGTNYQASMQTATTTTLSIFHQTSLTNIAQTGSGAPAAFVASTAPILRGTIIYRAA